MKKSKPTGASPSLTKNRRGTWTHPNLWKRYRQYTMPRGFVLDLSLDISRTCISDVKSISYVDETPASAKSVQRSDVDALESGAIANPDENRMVGRLLGCEEAPQLAPTKDIALEITGTVVSIQKFATDVHAGKTQAAQGGTIPRLKCSRSASGGSGASARCSSAMRSGEPSSDRMKMHFIDNTDPDGIARMLETLKGLLPETLVIVTSKSGGTPDTRNGMVVVAEAYRAAHLDFARHAVAVTMAGSHLDKQADSEGWLARIPMFDWVGGRTSELSAVGLLPAALQGIDIVRMLAGAAECDAATRVHETGRNPAALMALMWYAATDGKGKKDLVVLPYKDRLLLFSRYLQQLVMESLGKQLDLDGRRVEQGIAVYGNKGSTDQHAFVQQLRDGVNNFFVTFVRVLELWAARLWKSSPA